MLDGTYLIEVDRLLRPEGYLVISGPPLQCANQDKEWADLQATVHALCYKLITVDGNTAIWKKPSGASCLPNLNNFRLDRCSDNDDPNEAWYFKLRKCITKVPLSEEISIGAIPEWPQRLSKTPARVSLMKNGIDMFEADKQRWARRVVYYKKSLGVELGNPRIPNLMDMLFLEALQQHYLLTQCSLVDLMVEMDRMLQPQGNCCGAGHTRSHRQSSTHRPCDPVDNPGARE
ncbi:hypothetical protein BHE74_00030833 [Ensete ventricosum]|nr:hypothetical protein BHE74_00030833 [Ensete ventricosum]